MLNGLITIYYLNVEARRAVPVSLKCIFDFQANTTAKDQKISGAMGTFRVSRSAAPEGEIPPQEVCPHTVDGDDGTVPVA